MTTRKQIWIVLFTVVYLLTVYFTDISWTGYWTDLVFSVMLIAFSLKVVFDGNTPKRWLTISLRLTIIVSSILVFGLIGLHLSIIGGTDTFKLKSFYYQSVEGRLFNAYFKPVGAYSGGEGNFWITESPKYFPIIEIDKYYKHAILWDFRIDEWEGEPVNQSAIVDEYILSEVINGGR